MQRQAARTGGVVVDSETAALLNYADTQFRVSEGLFDITARSLSALWDRARSLPADEQISDALDKTGWNRVRWDGTNLEIPTGMSFDLGGIVKEYAADRAAVILKEAGFESGYVDLGGDLHVLGPHPDGRPWQVGIRNPNDKGSPLAAVEVRSGGLASSGDYERFSEINGRRYGHIINPRTGWPVSVAAESLASVSAVAPSCLLAGSVTTLAMLAGAKQGISLLEESGLSWFAVTADHSVSGTLAPSKLQPGA
jgi:thiamine biosynthesis lipoprotein